MTFKPRGSTNDILVGCGEIRPEPIMLQFKIAYYAFEQCSKFFPIMLQLCSTVPNYVCSIMLHKLLLPESED